MVVWKRRIHLLQRLHLSSDLIPLGGKCELAAKLNRDGFGTLKVHRRDGIASFCNVRPERITVGHHFPYQLLFYKLHGCSNGSSSNWLRHDEDWEQWTNSMHDRQSSREVDTCSPSQILPILSQWIQFTPIYPTSLRSILILSYLYLDLPSDL